MVRRLDSESASVFREALDLEGPILVTGAGGFIGARTLEMLGRLRTDVIGTVREEASWRLEGLTRKSILKLDLTNSRAVRKFIAEYKPKTIFHFATYGAYSDQNQPRRIMRNNVDTAINIVSALERHSYSAFVNAGTSSEYGLNSSAPSEQSVLQPNSYYAVAKVAADSVFKHFARTNKRPYVNLRLYSVFGPHEQPTRLVPQALLAARAGKYPPLVNPNVSRDFVYVDDVVRAFVKAARYQSTGGEEQTFNIGSGHKMTVADFIREVRILFGLPGEPQFETMQNRNWDLTDWSSDSSLARERLGWKPKVTLRTGLRRYSNWIETCELGPYITERHRWETQD